MLKYINKTAEEVRDMTDIEIRTNIMNALIECRKEKALTQEQVASAFEVKPTTVASWEQGKSLPNIQTLYRLATYYHKTIGYMYGEKDNGKSTETPYFVLSTATLESKSTEIPYSVLSWANFIFKSTETPDSVLSKTDFKGESTKPDDFVLSELI